MTFAHLQHDRDLFDGLLRVARPIDASVRSGAMFGCPAIFYGNKMAACVYGKSIGLKVPEDKANEALAAGRATHFNPYGKPNMREWIAIDVAPDDLGKVADIIAIAMAYAKLNNTASTPPYTQVNG